MEDGSSLIHIDAVNLPSRDSTQSRVDVTYRLDRSFLVPVRSTDAAVNRPYLRRGEILIEVVDSSGASQARNIERIEVGDEQTERPPLEHSWYQGVVSFDVPPGRYHLRVELSDLESKRKFLNDRIQVVARSFSPSAFAASDPFFVFRGKQGVSSDSMQASNFGGDLQFSAEQDLMFVVTGIDTSSELNVEHTLSIVNHRLDDSTVVEHVPPTARTVRSSMLDAPVMAQGAVIYTIGQSARRDGGVVLLPLNTQLLPLRQFLLSVRISQGAKETRIDKRFNVVWPEMPFSLKDVDLAVEVLRYIVTGGMLDSLRRGSFEERRDRLEAFWKTKDRTPSTAYNEMMTEYYRRVDHTIREFGSLRQPEGWKSDRGRAYILFGPPTAVRRTLDPVEGFREIWTYDRLRKKLTFLDQTKTGDYFLTSTTEL
jgi:GWxTD domain-containing protein